MIEISQEDFEIWASDADVKPKDVRLHYSGRGMYGKTCPGIVGNDSTLAKFLVHMAISGKDFHDAALAMADGISTDSMGKDTIYYFRGVKLTD
jgi:hypothetical protein